jgi:hypothetical protein
VSESFLILADVYHTCCLRYGQGRTVDMLFLYCGLFTRDDIANTSSIGNEMVVGAPLDFQHIVSFLPEISYSWDI